MRKRAKTNSISRNSRVAKKKPFCKRGLADWFNDAYRWLNPLMFAYNNFDGLKTLLENISL